jgi:hypothetical protein
MNGDPRNWYGPWLPGLSAAERMARWRSTRALAFLLCGEEHPLTRALLAAELGDERAAADALEQVDKLPPLRRRRLLATMAALRPPRAAA